MKYVQVSDGYIIRLDYGEKLKETLLNFIGKKKIRSAWLQGIGGLQWAELGFYDLDQQSYNWHRFDELLELTSMQGNVAILAGQPVLHMHGTVGTKLFESRTGHINEAMIAGTCEIYIRVLHGITLSRALDKKTGLNGLVL